MRKPALALAVALITAVLLSVLPAPAQAQEIVRPLNYDEMGLAQLDCADALMTIRTALLDAGQSKATVDGMTRAWLASIYNEPWTLDGLYDVFDRMINTLGTMEAGWIQPAEVLWAMQDGTIASMDDVIGRGMWRYEQAGELAYADYEDATPDYWMADVPLYP